MSVRLSLLLLALFATLCLLACRKQSVVYIKRIANKSQKTLQFNFHGLFDPLTYGKTVTVHPGEVKQLLYYNERHRFSRRTQSCHLYRDSVESVVVGGGRLRKALTREDDWSFIHRSSNQICTFEVTDEDIE